MIKITIEDLMRIMPIRVEEKINEEDKKVRKNLILDLMYFKKEGKYSGKRYRDVFYNIFRYFRLLDMFENTFINTYIEMYEKYKNKENIHRYQNNLNEIKNITLINIPEKGEKVECSEEQEKAFILTFIIAFVMDDMRVLLNTLDQIIVNKNAYFKGQEYMLKKNIYYTIRPKEYLADILILHNISYILCNLKENKYKGFEEMYNDYIDEYVKFFNNKKIDYKSKNLNTDIDITFDKKLYKMSLYYSISKFIDSYEYIHLLVNKHYDYIVRTIYKFFNLEWSENAILNLIKKYSLMRINIDNVANTNSPGHLLQIIRQIYSNIPNDINLIYTETNDLTGLIPMFHISIDSEFSVERKVFGNIKK